MCVPYMNLLIEKEAKVTHISSAFSKKAYKTSHKIQICSEKKRFCYNENHYLL